MTQRRDMMADYVPVNERPCNFGLGKFYDNPAWLRIAADYIEAHS